MAGGRWEAYDAGTNMYGQYAAQVKHRSAAQEANMSETGLQQDGVWHPCTAAA